VASPRGGGETRSRRAERGRDACGGAQPRQVMRAPAAWSNRPRQGIATPRSLPLFAAAPLPPLIDDFPRSGRNGLLSVSERHSVPHVNIPEIADGQHHIRLVPRYDFVLPEGGDEGGDAFRRSLLSRASPQLLATMHDFSPHSLDVDLLGHLCGARWSSGFLELHGPVRGERIDFRRAATASARPVRSADRALFAQFIADLVDLLTRLYPKLLRNAAIAELSRTIVLEELKNDVGIAHRRHHNASGSGNPANASTGSGSGGVSP